MDRNVVVRFYEIAQTGNSGGDLVAAFKTLEARAKRDREYDVGDAVVLRLEYLEEKDGLLLGDITRVQTHNLPAQVLDNALNRLPADRIGHNAAFLYDPATKCLAFQFDQKMGAGRLLKYVKAALPGSNFGYLPYIKKDTLERFKHQRPTKLRLRVARVRNFDGIKKGKTDFEDQLEHWANYFEAPSIEIILSTRGEDRSLDYAATWNTIRRWLSFNDEISGIKNIEAETIEADDAFNFVNDLLKEGDTLKPPDNDPPASLNARLKYVRQCYEQHRDYITRVSGAI